MAGSSSRRDTSSSARFRWRPSVESFMIVRDTSWRCRCWWIRRSPCPAKSRIFLPRFLSSRASPAMTTTWCWPIAAPTRRSAGWRARPNDETIERIKSLNLQGIHFQKEPKRFYPARDLAAQVLGSVGMEDSGQSGIEHEFDDELRGRPGKMFISVDARKQWFSDVETQPEPGREPGSDHRQEYSVHRRKRAGPGDSRHAGDCGHGDRRESAHGRNSGAGQPADVQSEPAQADHAGAR